MHFSTKQGEFAPLIETNSPIDSDQVRDDLINLPITLEKAHIDVPIPSFAAHLSAILKSCGITTQHATGFVSSAGEKTSMIVQPETQRYSFNPFRRGEPDPLRLESGLFSTKCQQPGYIPASRHFLKLVRAGNAQERIGAHL